MPSIVASALTPHVLEAVCAALIAGIGLCVFVSGEAGLSLMLVALAAAAGYLAWLSPPFGSLNLALLLTAGVLGVIGLTVRSWSTRLGLHIHYLASDVMQGAMIGGLIGGVLLSLPGLALGTTLGIAVVEIRRHPDARAFRNTVASLMSLVGPRGLQLLLALVVALIGLQAF